MIKAVIFDMDGVLIDSEIEYLKMNLEFAQKKNPAVRLEDLFGMVGTTREDCWGCFAKAINNGQSWQELHDEYYASRNVFAEMDYQKIFRKEIPGILEQLKAMGLRIALASSTRLSLVEHVLEINQIRPYFELVVSGAQFKRSKPDPEIYHYTAAHLGLEESECLVIEDSTVGVTAASRAGMKIAALIDTRFGFDQSLADYRMESLNEIPGIAKTLMEDR